MFQITEQSSIQDPLYHGAFLKVRKRLFAFGDGVNELSRHQAFDPEDVTVGIVDFVSPDFAPDTVGDVQYCQWSLSNPSSGNLLGPVPVGEAVECSIRAMEYHLVNLRNGVGSYARVLACTIP